MACDFYARARLLTYVPMRVSEKKIVLVSVPFLPDVPDMPSKINNVYPLVSVDMKKPKCKHCPIPGCHSKFLVRLANHAFGSVRLVNKVRAKSWVMRKAEE